MSRRLEDLRAQRARTSDDLLPAGGRPRRFDVALAQVDGTYIVYHVPTYNELVQSLVDIAPIAGTDIRAVAVVLDGRQLSPTFTRRALASTGIARVKTLDVW